MQYCATPSCCVQARAGCASSCLTGAAQQLHHVCTTGLPEEAMQLTLTIITAGFAARAVSGGLECKMGQAQHSEQRKMGHHGGGGVNQGKVARW